MRILPYILIMEAFVNPAIRYQVIKCKVVLVCLLTMLCINPGNQLVAQRLSRELNVDLLINQAGYTPGATKIVIAPGNLKRKFEVIELESQQVMFEREFEPEEGDFGSYSTGDFSEFSQEGYYYLKSDTLRSFPFRISTNIYQAPIELIVSYFSKQRCGASKTGYLAPCHTDDGIRMDNGQHQDVTGGWHDASDLRKWVGATIYGMIGLAKTYELQESKDRDKTLEELMWGNQYFLKMQEPEGYIMNYIGGDVKKHSDSNRWTDNAVGEEGGELEFVKPNAGRSRRDMFIFGTNDDRVIRTDPLGMLGQYNFITSEAAMGRITKDINNVYSNKCLEAAKLCFRWCQREDKNDNPGIIGSAIQAALELYKTTEEDIYKEYAIAQAKELVKYQARNGQDEIQGYFYEDLEKKKPYKNIWNGCLELIPICDLITMFPSHEDVADWQEMVKMQSKNYLEQITSRNSFGIVPYGLYANEDPGGDRKIDNYWYRYFMQPELDWWVGINANLASAGLGMLKAGKILDDPSLRALGQRQLDWILGSNPFNSSTMVGVGYNHPRHFPGSTFYPLTPVIPGAVLNGLGGNALDMPEKGNGGWQISEYWTPMVAYTLWLMAELNAH